MASPTVTGNLNPGAAATNNWGTSGLPAAGTTADMLARALAASNLWSAGGTQLQDLLGSNEAMHQAGNAYNSGGSRSGGTFNTNYAAVAQNPSAYINAGIARANGDGTYTMLKLQDPESQQWVPIADFQAKYPTENVPAPTAAGPGKKSAMVNDPVDTSGGAGPGGPAGGAGPGGSLFDVSAFNTGNMTRSRGNNAPPGPITIATALQNLVSGNRTRSITSGTSPTTTNSKTPNNTRTPTNTGVKPPGGVVKTPGGGGPGTGGPGTGWEGPPNPATYTGLPMRGFDPSYLIQQMRKFYGGGPTSGQPNSVAAMPKGWRGNNLAAWSGIFSRG